MVPPVKRLRLASAPGLLAMLYSGGIFAQTAAGTAPAPAPAPASAAPATGSSAPASSSAPANADARACFPACRDGFTCYQGQCVSLCNPACPAGLECVEGRRCEPPVPGARSQPYEPPPPPQKKFEELSHTLLGFHWGVPGRVSTDGSDGDADTTLGFNLRADAPIAKYVLLGPMLQFGSWRPTATPALSHNYYVDLDLLLRLRLPITTSTFNYQLWLGMPVGVSGNIPNDTWDADLGIGWNIGVLCGGAVHFSPKFGLFAEVGWEQHRFQHSRDSAPDLDFALRQAMLNLGIVLRN